MIEWVKRQEKIGSERGGLYDTSCAMLRASGISGDARGIIFDQVEVFC